MRLRSILLVGGCSALSAVGGRIGRARGRGARRAAAVDLCDLVDGYDAFLLDQFGVVHDGARCYGGAAEAVRALQASGKRLVVVSNSSRRKGDTIARFEALTGAACTRLAAAELVPGFHLCAVVTSGDLVHDALRALAAPGAPGDAGGLLGGRVAAGGGKRAYVFGNGDDDGAYLASAGVTAAAVEAADFVLARGLFVTIGETTEPLDYGAAPGRALTALAAAAARGLPLVVANPDLARPDGRQSPMPGVLAAEYARLGGDVVAVGKPHAAIFDAALAALDAAGVDRRRVCMVGDSLHHDVAGAAAAGIDSVWVADGVHAADLGLAQGTHGPVDAAAVAAFLESFDDRPTHVIPGFTLDKADGQ